MSSKTFLPDHSRRAFLQTASSWAAWLATVSYGGLAHAMTTKVSGWNLWGGKYAAPSAGIDAFGYYNFGSYQKSQLFHLDLKHGSIAEHSLRTPTHAILQHPAEERWLACSSKRTDAISLFDRKTGKEIAFAVAPKGCFFNGHTVFAEGGKFLIATGTDNLDGKFKSTGYLQVYSVPDLKPLDTVQLGRVRAHDLVEVRKDTYVAGLFGGERSGLHFGVFDFQKREFKTHSKYLNNVPQKGLDLSITHVTFDPKSNSVMALANAFEVDHLTKGTVCRFDCATNEVSYAFTPGNHNLNLELLSLAYDDETGYLWITVPQQNAVLVWDTNRRSFVTVIESWRFPQSVSLAANIDAVLIGSASGLKAHHRQNFRHMKKIDTKWESLSLNAFLAPHTRLI